MGYIVLENIHLLILKLIFDNKGIFFKKQLIYTRQFYKSPKKNKCEIH